MQTQVQEVLVPAAPFVHDPLQDPENSIRLFRLDSNQPDGVLGLSLEVYLVSDLESKNPYYALSYEWGNRAIEKPIFLNGRRYLIYGNLHEFLKQLRRRSFTHKLFWADAICINQDDVIERNAQVQHMARTYKQAQASLVWLGPGSPSSDRIFDLCNDDGEFTRWEKQIFPNDRKKVVAIVNDTRRINDVVSIFLRPYWSRLWVIQELLLAPEKRAFCGDRSIGFLALRKLHDIANRVREQRSSYIRMHNLEWEFNHCSTIMAHLSPSQSRAKDLYSLVSDFRHAKCADVHDRIYGLLCIIEESQLAGLRVDYALPLSVLYLRLLNSMGPAFRMKIARGVLEALQLDRTITRLDHQRLWEIGYGAEFRSFRVPIKLEPIGMLGSRTPSDYTRYASIEFTSEMAKRGLPENVIWIFQTSRPHEIVPSRGPVVYAVEKLPVRDHVYWVPDSRLVVLERKSDAGMVVQLGSISIGYGVCEPTAQIHDDMLGRISERLFDRNKLLQINLQEGDSPYEGLYFDATLPVFTWLLDSCKLEDPLTNSKPTFKSNILEIEL